MSDYSVWVTVRDWLLGKGWLRDGDDPGIWLDPGDPTPRFDDVSRQTFSQAFGTQVRRDGWLWDGPAT